MDISKTCPPFSGAPIILNTLTILLKTAFGFSFFLALLRGRSAKQLKREGKIGVLKKGTYANIVAFGPSLETDIHALLQTAFVMKDGAVYVGKEKVQ